MKQHGIEIEDIPNDISLLIVPDASSNEVELHKQLNIKNIDVIVLDHHETEEDASDPAIIVNNQISKNYINKALSGAGVVYRFCEQLAEYTKHSPEHLLDLTAVGLIGDMMDLRSFETRYYINTGLDNIRNPYLQAMISKNKKFETEGINPHTVAFYIVPFINAINRAGTIEEKKLFFKALLNYEANTLIKSEKKGHKGENDLLVEEAIRISNNVKRRQENSKIENLESIYNFIEENQLNKYPILVVPMTNTDMDRNLTGLIANQIMADYKKPTLILNKRWNEKINNFAFEGSGRGYKTAAIVNWREYCKPYAIYAEGHPNAFGIGFTTEQLEFFFKIISDIGNVEKNYEVDFSFSSNNNIDDAVLSIARYKELWGQELSEPYVVLHNMTLTFDNIRLLKSDTLKITFDGHQTSCIRFRAKEIYDNITDFMNTHDGKCKIDIIATCAINNYLGKDYPQIKLVDYNLWECPKWEF